MSAVMPVLEIRSVDPGRCAGWWFDAACALWRHALRWLALGLVLMLVLGLAASVPVAGAALSALLTPLLLGGWMQLAHDSHAGMAPGLRGLVAGFRAPHRRPLLALGAGLAACSVLIVAASHLIGVQAMLGAVGIDGPEGALAKAQLGRGMLVLLLLLVISMFITAALWFAPALVVLRGATPWAAVLASLRGVRDNGLTFLLFVVVQTLIAAVATLPYHVGWVLLVPTMLLTAYTSYRDVFGP
jgi:hypothetical protein